MSRWLLILLISLWHTPLPVAAGPLQRWFHNPKPRYSPLHYWFPRYFSAQGQFRKDTPYTYAVDRFPNIPFGYKYVCPARRPHYPVILSPSYWSTADESTVENPLESGTVGPEELPAPSEEAPTPRQTY